MTGPRVLQKDVYDTLELSALAYGGIGCEVFSTTSAHTATILDDSCPVCIHGHAMLSEETPVQWMGGRETRRALLAAGIFVDTNDDAVRAINKRKGRAKDARVTWREFTRELNIVRGDV